MRSVLLLVVLSACGAESVAAPVAPAAAAPAVTPAVHELGLYPGESMTFEVKLAGILVGDAALAVGEFQEYAGHQVVIVHSKASTAGAAALLKQITDEATSAIDVTTGHPVEVETEVHMNSHVITSKSTFDGPSAEVTYVKDGVAGKPMHIAFGTGELHDAHSAMADLRGWKAAPGTKRTVYVVGGRRLWRVDVTFVGEDTIGTEMGNRHTVVFDGQAYRARRDLTLESQKPARSFRVWLSDDADRVPVQVSAETELGSIEMTLTDYQRP